MIEDSTPAFSPNVSAICNSIRSDERIDLISINGQFPMSFR